MLFFFNCYILSHHINNKINPTKNIFSNKLSYNLIGKNAKKKNGLLLNLTNDLCLLLNENYDKLVLTSALCISGDLSLDFVIFFFFFDFLFYREYKVRFLVFDNNQSFFVEKILVNDVLILFIFNNFLSFDKI